MLLNCDTICVLKGQSHYNSCINPPHVKDLKAGDDIGLETQVDLISDVVGNTSVNPNDTLVLPHKSREREISKGINLRCEGDSKETLECHNGNVREGKLIIELKWLSLTNS